MNTDTKITVSIAIPKWELDEMKTQSRVDLNAPAVLALARLGLEAEKARNEK